MAVDEREFIDMMYQGWSKTKGGANSYWMPEEMVNNPAMFKIVCVTVDPESGEESKQLVASFVSEEDAAFITAVHGSFGDLTRRVLEVYDEADRLDEQRDGLMCRIAELETELDEK